MIEVQIKLDNYIYIYKYQNWNNDLLLLLIIITLYIQSYYNQILQKYWYIKI